MLCRSSPDSTILVLRSLRRGAHTPKDPGTQPLPDVGGWLPRGMLLTQLHCPYLLLLLVVLSCLVSAVHPTHLHGGGLAALYTSAESSLVACLPVSQPKAPSAQVMDFLFEKWKLYSDQCHHNLSLLPPPTGESHQRLLCPDTPPGGTLRDLMGM